MSRRTERINEQLRAELARLLRVEITDPRIGLVVLHRVDVSPDLRNARVFWSALTVAKQSASEAAAPEAEVQRGLDSAASFLRRRLAQLLPLRRVPELRFQHDPSVALGAHTLARLKTLNLPAPAETSHGPASEAGGENENARAPAPAACERADSEPAAPNRAGHKPGGVS